MKNHLLLAAVILVAFVCCPTTLWAANAGDFTIAIDAGHGSQTAGKRTCPFTHAVSHSYNGQTINVNPGEQFREHLANTAIAENLAQILTGIGFKVVRVAFNDMNGDDDGDPGLGERQAAIRNAGAVVSISCHQDAFGDGWNFNSAAGLSIWVWQGGGGESRRLADIILPKVIGVRGQQNRGVRENVFAMCNTGATGCRASILIEHAFMTNEHEAHELVCNPEVWHAYAVAEAQGVCEFLDVPFSDQAVNAGGASAEPLFSDEEMREMGWSREGAGNPDGGGDVNMDEAPKSELGLSLDPPPKEEAPLVADGAETPAADGKDGKIIAQASSDDLPKPKAKRRAPRKNNNAAVMAVLGLVGIAVVAGLIIAQNGDGKGKKNKRRVRRG